MLIKSLKITAFLLCQLAICASFAQTPTVALFSQTLRTEDKSFQSEQLSSAENRMRIVRLISARTDKKIDLSQPLRLALFDNIEYTVQLERQVGTYLDDVEVWHGRVADRRFNHLSKYVNTVFVVNPKTNKLVANIETDKGFFQILPTTGEEGNYRIRDCKGFDGSNCGVEAGKAHEHRKDGLQLRADCGSACFNETDATGKHVMDVFAGYSDAAAAVAGDLSAHAQANIQTITTGLANSNITTVSLRLVGTGTTSNNPGIITSVLTDCRVWFAAQIETLAPDMIAVFQTPTGAAGEAGGWGYIGGNSLASVNGVAYPTVFRHEAGHNVGGNHCFPDNNNYKNGYNNGNWTTHMCGNATNFYSNPSINDNLGNPIGNAAQADMARTWRERAAEMSKFGLHRVPYFVGDACVNQVCIPNHFGSQNELIKRVVFNTIDNNQANAAWTCATTTGYSDFTNLSTNIVRGTSHNITITPNYSFADSKVGVWIDFNRDGILSSAEQVGTFSGVGPWTTAVVVPATAALGNTRLRVRLQYSPSTPSVSCDGSGWSGGETEDYTVNISTVVPISLTDFKGENTENGNFLHWQTATEVQSSHFEIERSLDGQKFESIGRMAAQGKAHLYAFLDKNSLAQLTYYRLKMVDKDGSFDYSKIISLSGKSLKSAYSIFPNPTKGGLTLQISGYTEGSFYISFLNMMGQKVLATTQKTVVGLNNISLDLSALPNGVYIGEILENGKQLQNLKVIKN